MLQLPVELRRLCIESLDDNVENLKELRLVNKELAMLAAEILFRTAVLNPTNESAEMLAQLRASDYSKHVRCVIINTSIDPDYIREELELLDSFADAIGSLSKFSNIHEVQINFSERCAAEPDGYMIDLLQEVDETPEYRTAVLDTICKALEAVKALKVLSIRDLQDHMDRRILESEAFKSTLGKLTGLHLQIVTEVMEQSDLDFAAVHRGFTVDLPKLWLKPVLPHLTHLTLYSYTCMWGLYPFVDFRQIGTFPCLESLSLGNWTIAHDWQVDWIVSHACSLKQLFLEDCTIIPALKMASDDNMVSLNFPGLQAEGDGYCPYFKLVPMRWHQVFDLFRSSLLHLEHFAVYYSDFAEWADDAFDTRYQLNSKLRRGKYHFFDRASVPPWLDHPYRVQKNQPNRYCCHAKFPECHEEDEEALRKLVEMVRGRSRRGLV